MNTDKTYSSLDNNYRQSMYKLQGCKKLSKLKDANMLVGKALQLMESLCSTMKALKGDYYFAMVGQHEANKSISNKEFQRTIGKFELKFEEVSKILAEIPMAQPMEGGENNELVCTTATEKHQEGTQV